jgi:hypothetical protein
LPVFRVEADVCTAARAATAARARCAAFAVVGLRQGIQAAASGSDDSAMTSMTAMTSGSDDSAMTSMTAMTSGSDDSPPGASDGGGAREQAREREPLADDEAPGVPR